MRAIRQDTHGSPEVLKEVELPRPEPGLSEILIAVQAAGVNPTDWWNRAQPMTAGGLPLTLGWDVSGVVEAVGTGVTLFKPGDEVFGMLPYPHGVGAHAEYVTAPARAFTHKPAGIDHVQAGALPLAALTAYQALVDTADVQPGQRVFIHAAAGGVGHLAVQIAKSRGAYVIGTASAAKHDFLHSIGVDEAIDYHTVDIAEAVKDIDVVLDPVSLDTAARARSLAVLRPGGTLVSILPVPIDPDELADIAGRGIRYESLLVEADRAGMQAIADLVETGALRAHIAATFPLAEAAKAHTLGETGRTTGKIVLTVEGTVKKQIAQSLTTVFDGGDTTVIDRHVRPDYIQHNPLAPDGPEALKAFGAAWRQQYPDTAYDTKRVLSEGDLVLLHSNVVPAPGTHGMAVFDIFRFQDGKIAEHWDILQEVPATTANGNDMFSTLSRPQTEAPEQRWFTAYNKKLVTAFVDQLLVRKDLSAIDTYVAPEYRQHNPNIPDGVAGVKAGLGAYIEQFPQLSVEPKRIIAEGDLVAVHSHYVDAPGERGRAVLDLFRVRDGKIVEHWDAVQDVPETSANDNTMF
ncbi:SnoaL-like domain-containing protein [Streptomyces sp. HC44]|uniref:SnoaL-like domain-containing protein n=1 Tax=Streptomyces scabichelini TaxID=2711217 RepID=A0A6G4V2D2_9ACTN|nr:SnoaL-like domain-containing protein [Streptomyces scabichelini]